MELQQSKLALEVRWIETQAMVSDPGGDGRESENGDETNMRAGRMDNTLAGRTKRYGDIMRHVLPKMSTENSELPQFFETVEKLIHMYEVPDHVKAKLLFLCSPIKLRLL